MARNTVWSSKIFQRRVTVPTEAKIESPDNTTEDITSNKLSPGDVGTKPKKSTAEVRQSLTEYLWWVLSQGLPPDSALPKDQAIARLSGLKLLSGYTEGVRNFFEPGSVVDEESIGLFDRSLPERFFNSRKRREIQRAADKGQLVKRDEPVEKDTVPVRQMRIAATQEARQEVAAAKETVWKVVFETGPEPIIVSSDDNLSDLIKRSGVQMKPEKAFELIKMLQDARDVSEIQARYPKRGEKRGKFHDYHILGAGGRFGRILFRYYGRQDKDGELHIHMGPYKGVYGDRHRARKSPKPRG